MTHIVTVAELRSMPIADLQKEFRAQRAHVCKMRLQITMNTEKDTGRYRREKKQLARMMMVLEEKKTQLMQKPKTSRVNARKNPSHSQLCAQK